MGLQWLRLRQFWTVAHWNMIERNVGSAPSGFVPLVKIGDAGQAAASASEAESVAAPLPKIFPNVKIPSDSIAKVLDRFKNSNRNIRDVDKLQHCVKPQDVAVIIGCLKDDVDTCLSFFQWASSHLGDYKHGVNEYNAILWVLVAASKFDPIESLLEEMHKGKHIPDRVTFTLLLKCYRHFPRQAGRMFELLILKLCEGEDSQNCMEMVEFLDRTAPTKWRPTLGVFTSIVNTLVKHGHANRAMNFRNRMVVQPYKPDVNVYKVLLFALCKRRRLDEIKDLVSEMEEKTGCKPDFHLLTSLATACSRANRPGEAYYWYEQMQNRNFEPTLSTYNLLIDCLGKGGYLDWACSVFQDISKNSSGPEVVTYNSLMAVLCKGDRAKDAFRIYETMKQNGVSPDTVTYTVLIDELGKSYRTDEACNLFVEMVEHGCTPDLVVQTAMMTALIKSGDGATEATHLFKHLADLGQPLSGLCFRKLIRAFTRENKLVPAYSFFRALSHLEGYATLDIYNHLIFQFGAAEETGVMFKLFNEMKDRGIEPDYFTYRTSVDVFGRNGKLDRAEKFLAEMKAKGIRPDQVTYNKLIDMLGKTGDLKRSFKLMNEMEEAGHQADEYTYSSLLHNLGRMDKVDTAMKLFREMENRGCQAKSRTYNALAIVLAKADKVNEANELHRIMKNKGFMPDAVTYDELVQLNVRMNNPDIVFLLKDEMIGQGIPYNFPKPTMPEMVESPPEWPFVKEKGGKRTSGRPKLSGWMLRRVQEIEAERLANAKPSKKQQPWKVEPWLRLK